MKKGTKAALIAAGILLGTGVIATVAGLAMGASFDRTTIPYAGWRSSNSPRSGESGYVNSGTANEGELIIDQTFTGVTRLDVNAGAGEVQFVEGEGTELRVSATGRIMTVYAEQDGGELDVEVRYPKGTHDFGNYNFLMIIELPKDWYADEIDIEVGMGAMTAERLNAHSVDLTVGMGSIQVEKLISKDTSMDCSMGELVVRNAQLTGPIDLECGMGRLELEIAGEEADYGYRYTAGMGAIQIGERGGLGMGVNGNKEVEGAAGFIDADVGMGEISVNFT